MKTTSFFKIAFYLMASCFILGSCSQKQENIVLAYVTSHGKKLPDPNLVTHINYAFGHVDTTFSGITIENELRLHEITSLKQESRHLKVLLSIGGWGSGRFSEMAADDNLRMSFAKDCSRVIEEFNLDGIDLDWEYPSSSAAGISSSPDDIQNFTLLMKDIRNAIGTDKLLTLASVHSGDYIDFKGIDPYIDFVNIMVYDINRPPYHHAAINRSPMVNGGCCEEAVEHHLKKGLKEEKLVLGIPFYGHGAAPMPDFISYDAILAQKDYKVCWDSIAQVPYLADENGRLVCSYENPKSIAAKCKFAKQKGLRGIMYWEYNSDNEEGTLIKAASDGMK